MTTSDEDRFRGLVSALEGSRGDAARSDFATQLVTCDEGIVAAARAVAHGLAVLGPRFLSGDHTTARDAETVEASVHAVCRGVEQTAFVLLARQAPVGSDLRRVVAVLRLVGDVDRAATLLRHVCSTELSPADLPYDVAADLASLVRAATRVFAAGVDAWAHHDGLAVTEVEPLDRDVDDLQQALLERACAAVVSSRDLVALGLLGRYLERIADHGVAFARDIAYVITGERAVLRR